jgi:hypothetical protein
MKYHDIVIIVLIVACIGSAIALWIVQGKYNDSSSSLQVSYNDNQLLKAENSKLLEDNSVLMQKVNLKSFANEKELQRFLTEDDTNITFADSEYGSEACINLMRNARESGYWFSMFPCNTTDENIMSAAVRRNYGTYSGSWDVYAMTVIGDDSIYLVDPVSDTRWFKLMTFGADFQDYYTPKVIKSKVN